MIDYVEIKNLFNIEKGSLQSSKYVEGEYDFVTASSEWKKHKEYTHDTEALIVAVAASGSLGRVHYVNGKFIASDLCFILTPKSENLPVDLSFYYYVFKSIRDDLVKSTATGTSKLAINKTNFGDYKIPYIDITKQKKYKKKLIHVAERKEKLTNINREQVSLIQNLRSQILQDAITGKLSEQWRKENPNIESAEILLEKIKAEKEKLIKEGKLKKQKSLSPIKEEEKPFDFPDGWIWCRLGEIMESFIGGYSYKSERFLATGKNQVLRLGNVKPDKIVFTTSPVFIDEIYAEETKDFKISVNDILITMTGTRSKHDFCYTLKVSPEDLKSANLYLNQRVGSIKLNRMINASYINAILKEESLLLQIFVTATGSANQANIGAQAIKNWLLPIPPIKEQEFIADKVAKIFRELEMLKILNYESADMFSLLNKVVLNKIFEREQ